MQVDIHVAKTDLSDLIVRAEAGEEVIIARRGKPVVKLVPVKQKQQRRREFGRFAHLNITGDVLETLDESELTAWEGR